MYNQLPPHIQKTDSGLHLMIDGWCQTISIRKSDAYSRPVLSSEMQYLLPKHRDMYGSDRTWDWRSRAPSSRRCLRGVFAWCILLGLLTSTAAAQESSQ